jgi:hypothetical protein
LDTHAVEFFWWAKVVKIRNEAQRLKSDKQHNAIKDIFK